MSATLVYRRIVTERGRAPRFRGLLRVPGAQVLVAENPVCGDTLTLELSTDDGARLRYDGHACLVCLASADVLAESVDGATVADAHRLTKAFREALVGGAIEGLSPVLVTLLEVRTLPVRVACAKLPWDVVGEALATIAGTLSDGSPR